MRLLFLLRPVGVVRLLGGLAGLSLLTSADAMGQCVISLPGISAPAATQIIVPVVAGDVTGIGLSSCSVWMRYDGSVLDYLGIQGGSGGVTSATGLVPYVVTVSNEVRVGIVSATPLTGNGCMYRLKFMVKNAAASSTALDVYRAEFYPSHPTSFVNGQVSVAPSAEVSLSPSYSSGLVGTSHTVTASLSQGGAPRGGPSVTFSVISGPNAGQTSESTTTAAGLATFSYSSSSRGTDWIRVTAPAQPGLSAPVFSVLATRMWRNSVTDAATDTPSEYGLSMNPNPLLLQTRISLAVPPGDQPGLSLFDVRGHCIRALNLSEERPGKWASSWDGCDARGEKLPAGLYFLKARTLVGSWTSKLAILAPR